MQLWDSVLSTIEKKVSPQNFEIWFRPTSLFSQNLEEKKLFIKVPNRHFKYWLSENYAGVIDDSLRELELSSFQVAFMAADEETSPATVPAPAAELSRVAVSDPLNLNGKYTFESFVVGCCNQFAHAAALAVAEQPSRAYNPLFIYGGVGLGKTHLMHAIGHRVKGLNPHLKLTYMSSERFMNELIHSIRYDKMIQFRDKYRNIDILLMDDIQFLAGKERTQEEFFHTFNALYDSQKQIIISSDSPPREIPTLEERLHSRFEWGLIADLQAPDLETKIAILRKKADAQNVRISDEVVLFIATHIKSNVRELEGALVRLVAYSSLTGEPISSDLARKVLHTIADSSARTVSTSRIQKAVAEQFSLKTSDLRLRNNSRRIAEPRQIAMFLCKELTDHSLSDIGREFGGKHHTTVIHAVRKIEEKSKGDSQLRAVLDKLVEVIQR